MRRILELCLVLSLMATQGAADQIGGRDVVISDLRQDKTVPAPLVVMLHGAFGSPARFQRYSRFDRAGARADVMVVYAKSARRAWRDGRFDGDPVDVDYLVDLIARMQADPRVAPGKVLIFGHSSGGGMAMRMACARPDLVAGIGVVATKVLLDARCATGAAVPAVFVHGTADPIAPNAGRPVGDRKGGTLSAADSLSLWAARNGCRGPGPATRQDQVPGDGTVLITREYQGCQAGLTHFVLDGAGHGWPVGEVIRRRRVGPMSAEMDAGAALLARLRPLLRP